MGAEIGAAAMGEEREAERGPERPEEPSGAGSRLASLCTGSTAAAAESEAKSRAPN